jgi:peptidoglycan LD-endopeptidase LytH
LRSANIMARRRVPILIISGIFFIISSVLLINLETPPGVPRSRFVAPASPASVAPESREATARSADSETAVSSPTAPAIEAPATAPGDTTVLAAPAATSQTAGSGAVGEADLVALKIKNLLVPVAGITASQLRDSFNDGRSEGRLHQALDIMAPQGTPVLAVTDGAVARLFQSDKGGITLYQSDSSGLYFYYYAHLMRYADGITEGMQLKRGDVIGYVGDTGNAGAGNFHLHFAISKPATPGKWSGGDPINPYPLLAGK